MRNYAEAARSEARRAERQNRPLRAQIARLACAAGATLLFLTPAGAREVSLYAGVVRDGKPVTGLTAADFRVWEDGKPVPFRLEPLEEPAEVVLVVEASQSSYPYSNDIDTIMQSFGAAAPEGKWYALVSFSRGAGVDQDFTRDREQIAATWAALGQPAWSDIDSYDAVYQVLGALQRLPGRRAMIVIGSGYDTFSDHTAGDVAKISQRSNVLVYSIGAGSNGPGTYSVWGGSEHMRTLQGESFLDRTAKESGGRAWFPETGDELSAALKSVFEDFDNRYRLVYDADTPADGKLHKVKVEAYDPGTGKKLDVHVRKGWRSE
jgi:VWFA-related protein